MLETPRSGSAEMEMRYSFRCVGPLYEINTKNCSLSIVLTATDQKPQKSLKR